MPFGNKTQFLGDPFWRKRVRSGHTTLEKKGFLSPVVFRARERYVAVRTTYLGFDPFSYLRLAKKRVIFYPSKPGTWPKLLVGWVGINSLKIAPQKRISISSNFINEMYFRRITIRKCIHHKLKVFLQINTVLNYNCQLKSS